ncbi:MAG: LpxI family protein, partial [Pseudomonadota bacterium]
VAELAPQLLVQVGINGGGRTSKADRALADQGFAITRALGPFDIGQGCVLIGRRAVAVEGLEGTDAMLDRVARLRAAGRLPLGGGGVLVKCPKPGQDERVDLPAIGPRTISNAHAAGLTVVALEAQRTLIVDRDKTLHDAKIRGISIIGVPPVSPQKANAVEGEQT